ncbi:MAG TPA: alpha/beta fold hydrolase, partial [Actinoplanes sp.]|nr:alpha/beta fold hydrolase [Actinoplanes sp.]
ITRPRYRLPAAETRMVAVGHGDRLAVQVHLPNRRPRGPIVALIHGLTGSAESEYVRATAHGLLEAGFAVARVDLRGAGLSGETSAGLYHAGRTDDLRAVLRHLADEAGTVAPVGFSLGGNLTLKLLGEPLDGIPVVAGAAISAPLDLALSTEHLSKVTFGAYERHLIARMRRDATRPGTAVTAEERAHIARARAIFDFDNAITAPRNGWRDAAEYYALNSAIGFLARITLPTLVIHAMDDPMIPAAPYRSVDWDALPAVTREITAHGGHVGFHGRGSRLPWYVGRLITFLATR